MSINDESYIDEIIYTDIKIEYENENELFEKLSLFYNLHELTKKWH